MVLTHSQFSKMVAKQTICYQFLNTAAHFSNHYGSLNSMRLNQNGKVRQYLLDQQLLKLFYKTTQLNKYVIIQSGHIQAI
jgi:hypothetical protein